MLLRVLFIQIKTTAILLLLYILSFIFIIHYFTTYLLILLSIGGGLVPNLWPSYILLAGYSFLFLIVVSTYTANLTSILITVSKTQQIVKSFDDANLFRSKVCVQSETETQKTLSTLYPLIKIIPISTTNIDVYQKLLNNECDAAAVTQKEWDFYSQESKANKDCTIVGVGNSATSLSGAW